MNQPSILHLIDSSGMYGAERVVLTLLQQLQQTPFCGVLGCLQDTACSESQILTAARERDLPTCRFVMGRGIRLPGIRKLIKFINQKHIHLIHCHGYKPNIITGILAHGIITTKIITTVHGWAKEHADRKLMIYEKLNVHVIKNFEKCIAVSNGVSNDMQRRGIPSSKIEIIWNGISIDRAKAHSSKSVMSSSQLPEDAFVIGTACRLVEEKGLDILIKAAAIFIRHNPQGLFLIAGEGPLRRKLEAEAKGLGISQNILFLGFIEDIYSYLNQLDIFVLPSLTEGLPMILLEAMNARLPIVSSNVGGIPEVIHDHIEGMLIPPGNPMLLADALIRLKRDVKLQKKLADGAYRRVVDGFSAPIMAKAYTRLYSRLMT